MVALASCAGANKAVIAKSPAPRKAPDLVVKYSEKAFCFSLYRRRNIAQANKKLPNKNPYEEGSGTAVAHNVV